MTDAVLFNKWRSERDAEAFRELASRYSGMVYATCLRVLRNPQEAEEAAQECFEKLAGAPRIASPYLGPWLHKVATNSALGRLRSEGRRRIREDRYAREHGTQHTPEWEDIYPLVDEAIAGLPEELRVPLVRHFLENLTHEAIALELGVSRTTITYRLQKALERVRRTLKRRGVEVASTAFAALLGERMAEAAVVPATLEAALGCLAVAGLKAAPATAGGASALLGGLAVKLLLGAAAAVVALGFTWNMLIPKQPATVPVQRAHTAQLAGAESLPPAPKAVVPTPAPTPVPAEASPQAASEGGVVSGRVYNAKTGRGIAGVAIWAGGVECEPDGKAASNADGVYRITGLSAGQSRVRPVGPIPGYVARWDQFVEATVDLQKPAEGINFALQQGLPVSGRVVTADGKPVSCARVGAIIEGVVFAEHANTGDDGRFTIEMPTPGTRLQVQAKSGNLQSLIVVRDRLGEKGLSGIEVALTEPLTASIEGKLLLPNGSPAADYSVHVNTGNTIYLVGLPTAKVGADGSFKFEKLAAGTYDASFDRPGKWSQADVNELGPLTVEAGQALKNVTLSIPAATGGLSISGQAVDKSGKGIAQATIAANCTLPDARGKSSLAVTDERGAFTLSGLDESSWSVEVLPPDNRYSVAKVEDVEAGTRGLRIVLPEIGKIEGLVLNARDGKPLPNFETYLWKGDNVTYPYHLMNRRDISDPNGAFTREAVDVGPQTVTVKAPGFAQLVQVVQVTEGPGATRVEFLLEPAGPLTGKVTDEAGKPLANVGIYTASSPSWITKEQPLVRTAEDGGFTLEPLSPTITHIVAYHTDYPPTSANLDQLGSIVLEKGGDVEGHVTVDGQPVEGCRVSGQTDVGEFKSVLTNADGSYRLGPLPTRTTWLTAELAGRGTTAKEVTIEPGAVTQVDFDLVYADATIEGTVTISGEPVADAPITMVSQTEAGQSSKMEKTDAAGHYRFTNVPPGTAGVSFSTHFGEPSSPMWIYKGEIQAGQTIVQDITLGAPGVVQGKVDGVESGMMVSVFLKISEPGKASAGQGAVPPGPLPRRAVAVFCNSDGTFEIPNVPAGDYILQMTTVTQTGPSSSRSEEQGASVPLHVENGPVTVNLSLP